MLIKETPKAFSPLLPCENSKKAAYERALTRHQAVRTLIPASKIVRNKCLLLKPPFVIAAPTPEKSDMTRLKAVGMGKLQAGKGEGGHSM